MTDLTRHAGIIDGAALDGRTYLLSLLEQGVSLGQVSHRELARLREESLSLLARQADTWSGGGSTSMPVEKARMLLDSVYYTASLTLKNAPTPEMALERLLHTPLQQMYDAGQKRLVRLMQLSRALHRQLKRSLFSTPNEFYRATAVEGVDGFFKLYRPALAAQETHITADYPLFFGPPPLCGIEFIHQYVQELSHENRFCRLFDPERVHALLLGLDENYPQLVINLYGPILAAALGCVLTGQSVAALRCDLPQLYGLLTGKTASQIEEMLTAAVEALIRAAGCPAGLALYLRRSVPPLAVDMTRAVPLGCLARVVPCAE